MVSKLLVCLFFGVAASSSLESCHGSLCEAEEGVVLLQSAAKVAQTESVAQNPSTTTTTTLALDASAAELTGVGKDGAADMKVFLSGLQFDIALVVVFYFVLVFGLSKFPIIFKNNYLTGAVPDTCLDPADGWFGFARASLSLTGDQIENAAGLDRRMLVEYTHMAMKILGATSCVMILYMAPLNYLFGDGEAREIGDQLSYIDMGNVKFKHPWLYHLIALNCVYCSFVVRYYVNQSMRGFMELRFKWLEQLPSPRATTVMVEGIPDEYQSDEKLHEFFTEMLGEGSVKDARTAKHCRKLEALYDAQLAAKESLDTAVAEWEHLGKAEDKRPKLKSFWGSSEEDAIEHWTKEHARLAEEAGAERTRIIEEAKTVGNINGDSGFVTFTSVQYAEMAKNIRFSEDKVEWMCSIPPESSTVVWQDLRGNQTLQDICGFIGMFIAFAMYVAFTPVCIYVNNLASALKLGPLQSYWASLAPTLGLTIFLCFYPTVLLMLFKSFFELKSTLWAQHKLQSWYFWFQIFFVILVTAVGNNFIDFSNKVLQNPASIISLMADKMPKSTHFYMNYVAYGCVSHVMFGSRYMQLLKFLIWSRIFSTEKAKAKAEPEDPDYYGMGSQYARATILLCIGLVFGTMSPLVGILCLLSFAVMRLFYGYQVVYAETRKVDLGGIFWVTALEQTQKGMLIYNLLMFGVLSSRSPNWIPVAGAVIGLVWSGHGLFRFHEAYGWEQLPFTRALLSSSKHGNQQNGDTYVQPALVQ